MCFLTLMWEEPVAASPGLFLLFGRVVVLLVSNRCIHAFRVHVFWMDCTTQVVLDSWYLNSQCDPHSRRTEAGCDQGERLKANDFSGFQLLKQLGHPSLLMGTFPCETNSYQSWASPYLSHEKDSSQQRESKETINISCKVAVLPFDTWRTYEKKYDQHLFYAERCSKTEWWSV